MACSSEAKKIKKRAESTVSVLGSMFCSLRSFAAHVMFVLVIVLVLLAGSKSKKRRAVLKAFLNQNEFFLN